MAQSLVYLYCNGVSVCLAPPTSPSVPCQPGERWLGGEFISADRICCWSDGGLCHLYKLPTNCIVESKDFHNKSQEGSAGRSVLGQPTYHLTLRT